MVLKRTLANEQPPPRNTTRSANMEDTGFTPFYGKLSPFSQWYTCDFNVDNVDYNCAEQYMMHQKALLFNDHKSAEAIMREGSPSVQKQLGRGVRSWDQATWDGACVEIVTKGNFAKFTQNPDLLRDLMDTKNTILVEANPYDKTWGVGLSMGDPQLFSPDQWRGENRLGRILTEIREFLQTNNVNGGSEVAFFG
jgi:ribA/ribD-fused uncharacterized protein